MHRLLALLALAACGPATDAPTDDTDDTDDTDVVDTDDTDATGVDLTGVSPASGTVGAEVTLAGAGFGDTQGDSVVTVGGAEATVVSWSDTAIVVEVPDVLPGSRPVVVEVAGTPDTAAFEVVLPRRAYVTLGTSPEETVAAVAIAADGTLSSVAGSPFGAGADGDFRFGGVPGNIALDAPRRRLFVTANGAVSMFHIDGETGALTLDEGSPVDVGDVQPFGVTVSADGAHLYVVRCTEADVLHLTVAADGTIETAEAEELAACGDAPQLSADGDWLLVTEGDNVHVLAVEDDGSVTLTDDSPFELPDGSSYGWSFDPDGDRLYAACYSDDFVAAFDFDSSAGTLTSIEAGPWAAEADSQPNGIAFHPDGTVAYVSLWRGEGIEVFDVATDGSLTSRGVVDAVVEPAASQVTADGSLLLVVGQSGEALQSFTIDDDGDLTPAGEALLFTDSYPQGVVVTGF